MRLFFSSNFSSEDTSMILHTVSFCPSDWFEWVSETHCSPETGVGQGGRWKTEWGRQRWR